MAIHNWYLPAPRMPVHQSGWFSGIRYVVLFHIDWWEVTTIGHYRSEKALFSMSYRGLVKEERKLGRRPARAFRIDMSIFQEQT